MMRITSGLAWAATVAPGAAAAAEVEEAVEVDMAGYPDYEKGTHCAGATMCHFVTRYAKVRPCIVPIRGHIHGQPW
jgi:hypothetical protein